MTDWRCRRVVSRRPPDLSAAHRSAARAAHRPAPGRDDAAVRPRAPRRAGVQRLRLGLEHGRAEPRRHRRQGRSSTAARLRFTDGTIAIQNYVPMTADLSASFKFVGRQDACSIASTSITDGAVVDSHRRRRSGELAGADLPGEVAIQFPRMREIFFAHDKFTPVRRGRLHRHVPHVQGRPRAEGRLHQRGGRRQRLSLPEPRGLGGLGARSHGGDARDRRISPAARRDSAT